MTSGQPVDRELIIGVTPGARPDGRLVVGLARAGALGVLDLGADRSRAEGELALVADRWAGPFGVRVAAPGAGGWAPADLPASVDTVVVGEPALVAAFAGRGRRVLAEVTSLAEARDAAAAGADGLIAQGSEAGGRVGDETAFVLLQRLAGAVDRPVWLKGGIGLHTAAAALAGGAVGVVLDTQLALARESTLPAAVRAAVGAMDGSETVVAGGHRLYSRPDLPPVDPDAPPAEIAARLGADDLRSQLLPVGQDGSFAAPLAGRFKTAGGIVAAIRSAIDHQLAAARELRPLAPGAGTAAARGTTYPIAQGPMTRVSDRAAFAAAVAGAGGLPFLALSLMRGDEVRDLLAETAEAVGDRPWGVGVLGFVPPELRDEQLAVVRDLHPPVALIAGGRPSQAAPLEAEGITTFLHVPSPGLLDRFWRDGARRFVFEGRECGGHVGPRSSFALWERQIDRLLAEPDLAGTEVFFAGGIHDARSAAMVAALAAPLVERGAAIGVLMGTAYLFTTEAVEEGAITAAFQDAAVACDGTVLLETSPGHATRCVASEYVGAFAARKAELVAAGTDVARHVDRAGGPQPRPPAHRGQGDRARGGRPAHRRRRGPAARGHVHDRPGGGPAGPAHDRGRTARGRLRRLGRRSRRPRPAGPAGRRTRRVRRHRRRRHGRDLPRRPRRREVLGQRGRRRRLRDRGAGGPLGRRALLRPRRRGDRRRRPDAVEVGRLPARRPVRPAALRDPAPVARVDRNDQLLSLEVAPRALADAGYADATFDRDRDLGHLRRRDRHRPGPGLRLPGRAARTSSGRCPPPWPTCPASPRTRSPACWPTSSPGGSPTGSTSAAPTTRSTPPARRRWPRWPPPARSCVRRQRHGAVRRRRPAQRHQRLPAVLVRPRAVAERAVPDVRRRGRRDRPRRGRRLRRAQAAGRRRARR